MFYVTQSLHLLPSICLGNAKGENKATNTASRKLGACRAVWMALAKKCHFQELLLPIEILRSSTMSQ